MADISKLQIKYIPELFPNSTFDNAKFYQDGQVERINSNIITSKTEELWGLSWDNIVSERIKEAIFVERGQVIIYTYERTDLAFTMSDHCLITDVNNIVYNIYDVVITPQKEDRKYKYVLEFSIKNVNNISYPLSNDNSKSLATTGNSVNTIDFTINKCPFIQNVNITYNNTLNRLEFIFAVDEITKNINIGDVFAFHSNVQDLQGQISQAKCFVQTATTKSFYCITDNSALSNTYSNASIQLDYVQEITSTIDENRTKKDVTLKIYTQIKPKIGLISEFKQELEFRQGIKEYGNVTNYDTYRILFFLKESDLYLQKYFVYSDEISLTYNSITVVAEFRKDIIIRKDNDLTNQYEFELTIPVNVYNRNLHIL